MQSLQCTFKPDSGHSMNAAFLTIEKWASLQVKVPKSSTLSFVSLSCTLTTWWMNELMDLPIFHGQHSSNTQIQMKIMYYWAAWHSITQIWEQQYREMGPCSGKKMKGDLLALLSESLYSSQHYCLAKQGQPTMLHWWAQNKSATWANNSAGLKHQWRTQAVDKIRHLRNYLCQTSSHVVHESTVETSSTTPNFVVLELWEFVLNSFCK